MDIAHKWGSDLSLGPDGDLGLSDGPDYVRERALRRLMTSPLDDIWLPSYGAGLPSFVGQSVDVGRIASVIRSQLFIESRISYDPEPVVEVAADELGTVLCSVSFSLTDGQQIGMTFGMKESK